MEKLFFVKKVSIYLGTKTSFIISEVAKFASIEGLYHVYAGEKACQPILVKARSESNSPTPFL